MDREEDIYGRLLDLIASSESGRGARRGRDSVTMSTDAWDDMQSHPDAADFPASAALSTEHRSAIAVPWERPAAGSRNCPRIVANISIAQVSSTGGTGNWTSRTETTAALFVHFQSLT